MRFNRGATFLYLICFLAACGGNDDNKWNASKGEVFDSTALPNGPSLPLVTGDNVLPISVNGNLCSKNSYINKPCVSVQICSPETNECEMVSDILLDTGSYGLRVFKSTIKDLSLKISTNESGKIAECVQFGSGSDWGPVAVASVVLGNEPAVRVPIQMIDVSFANGHVYCPGADKSASEAGFNGILGVGPMEDDCGFICASRPQNRMYFSCDETACKSTSLPLEAQVQNPVALLPKDNNGVIIQLPSVPTHGARLANGYLVLGIGTRENNQPSSVTVYPADPMTGEVQTTMSGKKYWSFLDTGSNGNSIPSEKASGLATCDNTDFGMLCPQSATSMDATIGGFSGTPSKTISFQIGNAIQMHKSGNRVFASYTAQSSELILWGLPFHLGRNVFVGISGKDSPLGTGPYFAY